MKPEVVLCLDSESARHPEFIGLGDENLLSQSWLRLFCSAVEARQYLRSESAVSEVWVASSDEMDPINLAAALKKDSQEKGVYLLAFDCGGSMKSRANAAGLDATLSQRDLAQRYARKKVGRMHVANSGQADGCAMSGDLGQDRTQVSNDTMSTASLSTGALGNKTPDNRAESPVIARVSSPENAGTEASASAQTSVLEGASGSLVQHEGGSALAAASSVEVAPFAVLRTERNAAQRQTRQKKPAFILAVVSACGGAGKSTIAALSAYFAQGLGNKTLLIDGDMQFGDMHYLMGREDPLTIEDLAADPSKIERLRPSGMQPALLAAPKRLEQSEVVAGRFVGILEGLSDCFDVIVVNTASFWAEQHAQLLERSSCVLFLIDQRPSSLRSSRHALELCTRCGIATTPFVFTVNRCSRNSMFSSMDVACALGGSQTIELKDGGKEVDELLGAGQPLELIEARNDLCVSLEHALVGLLPNKLEEGTQVAELALPQSKRFRFGKRRRRAAACL